MFGCSPTAYRAAHPPAASHRELERRGVEFQQEPTKQPYGIDAAFRDPSGNEVRIVQRI
jgi:glyoxalase/bleomycin resistance protein/dioxygenase superfamily protein